MSALELIAAAKPMAKALAAVEKGEGWVFDHVVPTAQPMLAGVIVRAVKRRVWIVCPDVRRQEAMHNELAQFFPEAAFFPERDVAPVEGALPDPENAAERISLIQRLTAKDGPRVIVITRRSIEEEVPAPGALAASELRLKTGQRTRREPLLEKLGEAGFERVAQVFGRGQFAVRGGIVDVFPFNQSLPVRVEWFDDEVESLRYFDLDAQTSVEPLKEVTLLLSEAARAVCPLADYIAEGDVTVDADGSYIAAQVRILEGSEGVKAHEDFDLAFLDHGIGAFDAGDFIVDEVKRERFFRQLTEWREGGWRTFVFCNNEGEIERLRDLLPPVEADGCEFRAGQIGGGFVFAAGKIAVLSDAEIFGRYKNNRARRLALRRAKEVQRRAQIDFSELIEGELVVHLEHGIGRYEGMREIPQADGKMEEVLVLEFDQRAKLYVPVEQAFLISRYVGVGKASPALSTLGDPKWAKAKKNAEKAVFDYASTLLRVHAEREIQRGHAFEPDNKWQREFEASFLYKETADQLTSIAATKADMEGERPMDRLICGDVGFGKTEVAIRAAFKAVMGGKQVALLVPTTVLAEQHYRNFRERMSDYPVTVELLSRFRTATEQRKTLAGVASGSVDIVIGTHRLISKDVQFKNLGLVVIDEEQRFGVLHKEKFKALFHLVDMLTLSATPIPRTLYLSLMGAKDMSIIETPPPSRIPVETFVCPYDERIIREAVKRELERQGQVYFLHNRISTIEREKERIERLCPGARVIIGHGQMDEHELEEVMHKFVAGEADVLVSTTIIESGLDIPNANTIIIDRADRFGLADLYQLRGRVGRAQHKAYAYLLLPRDMMSVGEARKRVNAIKQYSSLGAGFKIAMRDLEIRGAGNILGTQQSGHIINVGFDLYCSLLRQAVSKIKGEKVHTRLEVALKLDFVSQRETNWRTTPDALAPAFLPSDFIPESETRIAAYRKLNELSSAQELEEIRTAWRDRFGRPPQAVENLLLLSELKLAAAARQITMIETREDRAMFSRAGTYILLGGKFPRLAESAPNARLIELLKLLRAF